MRGGGGNGAPVFKASLTVFEAETALINSSWRCRQFVFGRGNVPPY